MDESSHRFAEYTRPIAKKGQNRRLRRLLILIYIVFALFYCLLFTIPVKIPQVIALLPLFLWILIFYTQRLVNYEIQVSVTEGALVFSRVWNQKRDEKQRVPLKSILSVCKIEKGASLKQNGLRAYDFRADADAEDCYLATVKTEEGEALYFFQATEQLLASIRYYNKQAFHTASCT